MPIFARRVLQRLIDQVAPLSSAEKLRDQIQRLNKGGQDAISTAWELAVAAALSPLGTLEIEPNLGTSTRVDFALSMLEGPWSCIGDIVSIFDHGMREESGYGRLETVVWQCVQAHKLARRSFNIWIEADVDGSRERRRIRLPPVRESLLRESLKPFLLEIKTAPAVQRQKDLRSSHGIIVRYDPKQYSGTWSGTRIDAVYGIDANPLMNALKRKAKQLRKTSYDGSRIIVCCDGGSEALRARRNPVWKTPDTADIVQEFLRENTSIVGVVLILVNASPLRAVINARDRQLYSTPFLAGPQVSAADETALNEISRHLATGLPSVIRSPTSFPEPWAFTPDYGFFRFRDFDTMSARHIRISMRELLQLLAGSVSQEEYFARNELSAAGTSAHPNQFARWLSQGRVIKEARIIPGVDHDDDWVEITMSEPDPALAPLRATGANSETPDE
jgi:hypothetical protein